jgi:hypothetical protein
MARNCERNSSDDDETHRRVEPPEVVRVRGNDSLPGATRADHHVSVDHVDRVAGRQEPSDIRSVYPVERDYVSGQLSDQSSEPGLSLGLADGLGQGAGRNRDASASFASALKQHDDATIVPIKGDQTSRIKRDPCHQAAGVVRRLLPSVSSAQRRSSTESSPPVSLRASASIAPQPATSSSATLTACCTNPDVLGAAPDSTSMRTRSS